MGRSGPGPPTLPTDSELELSATVRRRSTHSFAAAGRGIPAGAVGAVPARGAAPTLRTPRQATAAGRYNLPFGVAADGSGNLSVVDCNNHRIEKFALPR
jgi:hypothetical protein